MSEDIVVQTVPAIRKGRGRRPCEISLGISDDGFVVLRAIDESGVSPIVALLKPEDARNLCDGLQKAVGALGLASAYRSHSVARKRNVSG